MALSFKKTLSLNKAFVHNKGIALIHNYSLHATVSSADILPQRGSQLRIPANVDADIARGRSLLLRINAFGNNSGSARRSLPRALRSVAHDVA